MSVTVQSSYDLVPYESNAFAQSHPDRLATIATLLGMRPAPVGRCRVLELGCASGGNLLPMAVALPGSTFVGLDQSARQVEAGQRMVQAVGLTNVELRQMDIRDIGPDLGRFDYIICHGVFSWVPEEVQDKILAVLGQNLEPRGVAYVSYNTFPGWHLRGLIRDVMVYHAKQFADPMVRVRHARNLLDFLAKSVAHENSHYAHLLKSELDLIRQCKDSYLFHDHLEEVNDPIYFHQFVDRAAAHGLQYLGEVDLQAMIPDNYPAEVRNVLHMLSPDNVHLEQYMDFLRNRMFRQTLLCHQGVPLNFRLRPEQMTAFHVASPARPVSDAPNLLSGELEKFQSPAGPTVSTAQPVVKAALMYLARVWPKAVPFEQLRAEARAAVTPGVTPDAATVTQDTRLIGECLLNCYATASTSLVELHVYDPPFVTTPGDRPTASPLVRQQAAEGNRVTNLRHEGVILNGVDRLFLPHLDGTRDRAGLTDVVARLVAGGDLSVQEHGQPVTEPDRVRALAETVVDERLAHLARSGLLIG